jgi:hypothetical protein
VRPLTLGNVVSRPLRYGLPEEAGMSSDRVRHVAQLAALWVAQGTTPALVVLIARRGVIVLHEAFGWLVQIHAGQRIGSPLWRGDLFANAAIAAIEDD